MSDLWEFPVLCDRCRWRKNKAAGRPVAEKKIAATTTRRWRAEGWARRMERYYCPACADTLGLTRRAA